jgi:hypothetical protein
LTCLNYFGSRDCLPAFVHETLGGFVGSNRGLSLLFTFPAFSYGSVFGLFLLLVVQSVSNAERLSLTLNMGTLLPSEVRFCLSQLSSSLFLEYSFFLVFLGCRSRHGSGWFLTPFQFLFHSGKMILPIGSDC